MKSVSHDLSGYYSTNEVMELTGLTKKQLDDYIALGIITPTHDNANRRDHKRFWSANQIALASHIPLLTSFGLSREEIAAVAQEGTEALLDEMALVYTDMMRKGRRGLKSLMAHARESRQFARNIAGDQPYLRSIPQRWLALLKFPSSLHAAETMTVREDRRNALDLRNTVEVVGWAPTDFSGVLISLAADGTAHTTYSFVRLASPPMPAFTGYRVIDGGCYIDWDRERGGCGSQVIGQCDHCTRFGRHPKDSELFAWKDRPLIDDAPWDRTVMLDDLTEPYPTGMWSEYTRAYLDRNAATSSNDDSATVNEKSPTVRPRLMPHVIGLPMGMTACVLPAGVYLCLQCEEGKQDAAFHFLQGIAATIDRKPFSLEDELDAARTSRVHVSHAHEAKAGPVPDPFAQALAEADPTLTDYVRSIDRADFAHLTIPTDMALSPEDGYCILCYALPSEHRDDPLRYELQLLVHPDKTLLSH